MKLKNGAEYIDSLRRFLRSYTIRESASKMLRVIRPPPRMCGRPP